jgi:hypothetical protein
MTLRKRIAAVALAAAVLLQLPFACGRYRLGALSATIEGLTALRQERPDPRFREFAGVLHVHTALGGHSRATFDELIEGGQGLDFVILTEHTADLFDTAALTLQGRIAGTLFVAGNEVNTISDRFLLIPGSGDAFLRRKLESVDFLQRFQPQGKLAIVAYPETFRSWDSSFDGIEVFNLGSGVTEAGGVGFFLQALWSFGSYPELTIASYLRRPDAGLRSFDDASRRRPLTLLAGSDAHSNIGYHMFGDDTGNRVFQLKLDDYRTVFRILRTHVLVDRGKELDEVTLVNALRSGHAWAGFDVLGSTRGFNFSAGEKILGDTVQLREMPNLKVVVPIPARIVLFHDGRNVQEATGRELRFTPTERGTYRVEVFLESLGTPFAQLPWILSNPIYVR